MKLIDLNFALQEIEDYKSMQTVLYYCTSAECEAARYGMDLAIKVLHNCPEVDAVPVVRGEWVYDENDTEWTSHQCSVCKKSSLREAIYEDDYDEGLDGEWFYLGKRQIGIIEHLANYCPNCGAKMDGEKERGE